MKLSDVKFVFLYKSVLVGVDSKQRIVPIGGFVICIIFTPGGLGGLEADQLSLLLRHKYAFVLSQCTQVASCEWPSFDHYVTHVLPHATESHMLLARFGGRDAAVRANDVGNLRFRPPWQPPSGDTFHTTLAGLKSVPSNFTFDSISSLH